MKKRIRKSMITVDEPDPKKKCMLISLCQALGKTQVDKEVLDTYDGIMKWGQDLEEKACKAGVDFNRPIALVDYQLPDLEPPIMNFEPMTFDISDFPTIDFKPIDLTDFGFKNEKNNRK